MRSISWHAVAAVMMLVSATGCSACWHRAMHEAAAMQVLSALHASMQAACQCNVCNCMGRLSAIVQRQHAVRVLQHGDLCLGWASMALCRWWRPCETQSQTSWAGCRRPTLRSASVRRCGVPAGMQCSELHALSVGISSSPSMACAHSLQLTGCCLVSCSLPVLRNKGGYMVCTSFKHQVDSLQS